MKINTADLTLGRAHQLLSCIIVPRPIALVSTIDEHDVFNLAPFSRFTLLSPIPMIVGLGISGKGGGKKKDTQVNIELSKEFVISVVTEDLAEAMNQSARNFPSNVDEFKEVGLTPVKSDKVKPPLVGESPINLECRLIKILELSTTPILESFIIGKVLNIHIKDEFYIDNEVNQEKLKAIARMGRVDLYCRTRDIFRLKGEE